MRVALSLIRATSGSDVKVKSYAGRFQIILALVFGVLLYSSMNAVLVSKLAIFEVALPFKSLEDVKTKRTHSLCLRTNSFVYNNFTVTMKLCANLRNIKGQVIYVTMIITCFR